LITAFAIQAGKCSQLMEDQALVRLNRMSTAQKLDPISVEDYLAGELRSRIKHEYLGGFVYAMAGATIAHNIIAGNIFALFACETQGK
jgi:Uma2 family endonuclease